MQAKITKRLRHRKPIKSANTHDSKVAQPKSLEQLLAECESEQISAPVQPLPTLKRTPQLISMHINSKVTRPTKQDASNKSSAQYDRPHQQSIPLTKHISQSAPTQFIHSKININRSVLNNSTANNKDSNSKATALNEITKQFNLPDIEEKLFRRKQSEEDDQRKRQADPRIYGNKHPIRRLHLSTIPSASKLGDSGLLAATREQLQSSQKRAEKFLQRVLSENHIPSPDRSHRSENQKTRQKSSRHSVTSQSSFATSSNLDAENNVQESYSNDDFDHDSDQYADDEFVTLPDCNVSTTVVTTNKVLSNTMSELSLSSESSETGTVSLTESHIRFPILRECLLTEADLPRLESNTQFDDFFATGEGSQLGTHSEVSSSVHGLGLAQGSFSFHSEMEGYIPGKLIPAYLLPPPSIQEVTDDVAVDQSTDSNHHTGVNDMKDDHFVDRIKPSADSYDDDFEELDTTGRRTNTSTSRNGSRNGSRDGSRDENRGSKTLLIHKEPSSSTILPALSAHRPSSSSQSLLRQVTNSRDRLSSAQSGRVKLSSRGIPNSNDIINPGSGSGSVSKRGLTQEENENRNEKQVNMLARSFDSDGSGELDNANTLSVPLVPLHRASSLIDIEPLKVGVTALSAVVNTDINPASNEMTNMSTSINKQAVTKPVKEPSGETNGYFPSVHKKDGIEVKPTRKTLLRRTKA